MTKRVLVLFFALGLVAALAVACGPMDDLPMSGPHRVYTTRTPDLSHVGSEIIGGSTDTGDKSVVLVYNQSGFLCTGSVVAPRTILTAAHCTVSNENCAQPNCSTLSASGYAVVGGTDPFNATGTGGAEWFFGNPSVFGPGGSGTVTAVHTGPLYNGQTLTQGDVGILQLSADAPVPPLALPTAKSDAQYSTGTSFKAVGYGLANPPPTPDTSGIKRTVQLTIQAHDGHAFQYGSSTQNTCSGDSGGPALVGNLIIGTVSYGDQNCSVAGVDMRTDDNLSFIGQFTGSGSGSKKKSICSVGDLDPSLLGALPLSMLAIGIGAFLKRRRVE